MIFELLLQYLDTMNSKDCIIPSHNFTIFQFSSVQSLSHVQLFATP